MPIELKITGESAQEVINAVAILAAHHATPAVSVLSPDKIAGEMQAVEAASGTQPAPERPRRGRPTKDKKLPDGPALNVQANPENRVNPESQADAEQDQQDEQPEEGVKEFTVDDVRNAAVAYQKKFGVAEVQADLSKLLTEKAGTAKINELAGKDQAVLKEIVETALSAVESGKRVGA